MNYTTGLKEYQEMIKQFPILSQEEEYALAVKGDKESKNKIVQSNLRLVVPWAYHYQGRGLDIEDLIEEGNLGLLKAIEKFDPNEGNLFCTYAVWWIKQSMSRAIINQGQTIRVPVHMMENIDKVKLAMRDLTPQLGRTPTTSEIAKKINLSEDKVSDAISYIIEVNSLDKTVGDEETTIGELIEDTKFLNPESLYINKNNKEGIIEIIDTLSSREATIIKMRYGLINGKQSSLEDIGKALNLSKERIRQLQMKAERKLRNPIRLSALKEYL